MKNKTYISEIISDQYRTWTSGDIIILKSGTDTGKTTFCKTLALYAKSSGNNVLYLVSRIAKVEQLKAEFAKENLNNLYIITYQKLEAAISRKSKDLYTYAACKYIYCDECHYFTDDISIPDSTPSISESWIRAQSYPIKIYASATAETYFSKLINKYSIPPEHIFTVPKSFDYIENIYVYNNMQLVALIDNILRTERKSKILVFVNSTEQMSDLYEIYKDTQADYLCSKNTKDKLLLKICNLRSGSPDISINKRILFTTKTLDIGVNICDDQLKHIICQIPDINTIIQCFGRKRPINAEDTCTFYIEDKTTKHFEFRRNSIVKYLNKYEEYKSDPEKFQETYKYDRNINKNGSVFFFKPGDPNIYVDYTLVNNYKTFLKFYENIKEKGYIQTIKDNIGPDFSNKISILPPLNDVFLNYIRTIETKWLFKKDQDKLIEVFKKQSILLNQPSKTYGIKVINKFLDKNYKRDFTKRLTAKRDRRRTVNGKENLNRDKTYWEFS